jgi:hypothetical protein
MYLIASAETPTFTTREAERGDELGSGLDQFEIGKVVPRSLTVPTAV